MTHVLECERCGRRTFYKKNQCLECGSDQFTERKPGEGKLIAITTVHITPDGVRKPNELGLATFPGNANIIAQLDDSLSVDETVVLDGDYELRARNDKILRGARLIAAD